MPDPIMYQADGYVVLRHDQPEQLMEADELRAYLQDLFTKQPDVIPTELEHLSLDEQLNKLMEDYCELDLAPGEFLQWYMVRFEK